MLVNRCEGLGCQQGPGLLSVTSGQLRNGLKLLVSQ